VSHRGHRGFIFNRAVLSCAQERWHTEKLLKTHISSRRIETNAAAFFLGFILTHTHTHTVSHTEASVTPGRGATALLTQVRSAHHFLSRRSLETGCYIIVGQWLPGPWPSQQIVSTEKCSCGKGRGGGRGCTPLTTPMNKRLSAVPPGGCRCSSSSSSWDHSRDSTTAAERTELTIIAAVTFTVFTTQISRRTTHSLVGTEKNLTQMSQNLMTFQRNPVSLTTNPRPVLGH